MKFLRSILLMTLCCFTCSCFTVVEMTRDDIYIDNSTEVVIINNYPPPVYHPPPVATPLPIDNKPVETKYRKVKERPSDSSTLRNNSGQRNSNKNRTVVKGNSRSNDNSENVRKTQRR